MAAVVCRARKCRLLAMVTVWMELGLSSCAYFTGDSAPQPVVEAPPQPPVAVVPPPVPPRPARKPRPSPLQQPSGQPPAAEDKTIDPEHLIGLDESDAAQWLGEPDQRTNAAPAAIWRYLSRDCQV